MPLKILMTFLLLIAGPAHAKEGACGEDLNETYQEAITLSHRVANTLETRPSQKRGYAILIGAMVGSAMLSTYVSAHLGPNFQFLSVFVTEVSTLGVYVFGAPIWEPISSKFRKLAFGVRTTSSFNEAPSDAQLEAMWLRTQGAYSLNSQMSRNITSSFITSIKQNFFEAYRAFNSDNRDYAADQVAEAAYRLKVLFKDIPATDASVAAAIHSAFTNHITLDKEFVALVWEKIKSLDHALDPAEYKDVINIWLKL